jgi:hypothetical protein
MPSGAAVGGGEGTASGPVGAVGGAPVVPVGAVGAATGATEGVATAGGDRSVGADKGTHKQAQNRSQHLQCQTAASLIV